MTVMQVGIRYVPVITNNKLSCSKSTQVDWLKSRIECPDHADVNIKHILAIPFLTRARATTFEIVAKLSARICFQKFHSSTAVIKVCMYMKYTQEPYETAIRRRCFS